MRHLNSLVITLFCALTFWGCSGTARAELPPAAYEQMRSTAPEVLEIEITDAGQNSQETEGGRTIDVFAAATVQRVKRSRSGLKKGEVITLRYRTFENTVPGWVGPSSVPIVRRRSVPRLAAAGRSTLHGRGAWPVIRDIAVKRRAKVVKVPPCVSPSCLCR